MKKLVSSWLLFSSALALVLSFVAFTQAAGATSGSQGSNTTGRPALRGARALGPFSIFDTNHDGVLSADEIANAAAVLRKLDKNGDGKLTSDELRPPGMPPPPPPPPDE